MAAKKKQTIVRKVEIIEESGHHGGAWKVAYADFMTAMMAFFLLLWILSSADEQKLRGIAEYFTNATMPSGSGLLDGATFGPPGTLNASRGEIVARGNDFGEVDEPSPAKWEVMDITPTSDPSEITPGTHKGEFENPAAGAPSKFALQDDGSTADGNGNQTRTTWTPGQPNDQKIADAAAAEARALYAADSAQFAALESELRQAIQENPDLKPLEKNVIFEKTPEGLRIQVVDQQGQPMFNSGSAEMRGATQDLMEKLGGSLADMPNNIVISGHTDAVPFTNRVAYDNWDLSSDRANAMRRVLLKSGVAQSRITRVSGMADTELLVPDNPLDPSNRRITVLLEYRKPKPAGHPVTKRSSDAEANAVGTAPVETPPVINAPASRETRVVPQNAPEQVTQLEASVFEDLRNALR
ncbi:flagellar motor protein MotB [Aquicoccus sp. SU-CL01552]|uniref:flagellar motor protein MotB n=1 Tax=Aquicoccus sp. SU-CL01552 TaxID=3127656 RepID=UPI003108A47F